MKLDEQVLDHAVALFPPPEAPFDRLLRRRDRRTQRRRVTTIVVALVIAAIATAGAVSVFRSAERLRPAGTPITPTNVASLNLEWSGQFAGAYQDGGVWPIPFVGNGQVYALSQHRVFAFDAACASNGRACRPAWYGAYPDQRHFYPYGVAQGGVTFVPGDAIYAFPAGCDGAGGPCRPLWHSTIHGDFCCSTPVLSNGVLYGTFYDASIQRSRGYALPVACDGASRCAPRWVTPPGGGNDGPAVSGNTVFFTSERRLEAFATDCKPVGASCGPSWTASPPGGHPTAMVAADGNVYLLSGSGDPHLVAYSASCAARTCSPLWTASVPAVSSDHPITTGRGVVAVATNAGTFVFPADCRRRCAPLWRGEAEGPDRTPAVIDGEVLYVGGAGGISAYRVDCRTDGRPCEPVWTAPVSGDTRIGQLIVADGVLFASMSGSGGGTSTLAAYVPNCATRGATCSPAWTSSSLSTGFSGFAVDETNVYAWVDAYFPPPRTSAVYAFGIPSRTMTSPTHSASGARPPIGLLGFGLVAMVVGVLVARSRRRAEPTRL